MASEMQKMIAGENYDPGDSELVNARRRARSLTRAFNSSIENETERRHAILHELFGRVDGKVTIEPPFYCDYGSNVFVGKDLFMNFGCVILDCAEVHIGDSVLCGPNVQIYTATHPLDAKERASGIESAKPIKIGNRVWLGGGAIICPGVTIGDDAVIGAGSVVTKSIPPKVLAAGNPCRIIKEI